MAAVRFALHRSRSGNLYCISELHAFAVFGARYQQLLDEYEKRLKDPQRQKQLYEEMVRSQAKFKAEGLGKMRAHLEQLQKTDPELFAQTSGRLRAGLKMIGGFLSLFGQIKKLPSAAREQMLRGLGEMESKMKAHYLRKAERNIEDQYRDQPELAARMKRRFADLIAGAEAQHEEEQPLTKEPYSPGKVRAVFGKSDKPTSNQEELFEWLLAHQDKVAKDVSEELFDLYQALDQSRQDNDLDADQQMLFPKVKTASELHDLVCPARITLDEEEPILQCYFDTTWKDLFGDRPQGLRLIYYKGKISSDGSECDPELSDDLLELLMKKPELAYKLG